MKHQHLKIALGIAMLLIVFCSCQKPQIEIEGNKYKLAFSDEFKGASLNLEKWAYRTDSKHWSTQLKENVELKDGNLLLHVKKEKSNGMEYTGAGIISKERFSYGYYETRMKIPKGAGWHNSFWLMQHDGSGSTETKDAILEIDIAENDSKNPLTYRINVHQWKDEHKHRGQLVSCPDMSEDFQVIACLYTPEKVNYFLNGKNIGVLKIDDFAQAPMNIWLTSIASWLGKTEKVDENKLPSTVEFDYVRYYEPVE